MGLSGRAALAGRPSLALDFKQPGILDSRITFTRASTATYTDASGTIQTAAIDQPRWDYAGGVLCGLLIEETRINLLLNSTTLGTQGVAVTAQAYTLSFYGTGTITKSGAATGALVGTGATQRVSQTFTPTAGTVTCTVTGAVTNAQLEAGAFATTWVPTAGATATRAIDVCSMPTSGGWYNASAQTLLFEAMNIVPSTGNYYETYGGISDGTTNNRIELYRDITSNNIAGLATVSGSAVFNQIIGAAIPNAGFKVAMAVTSGRQSFALNGVFAGPTVSASVPSGATTLNIGNSPNGAACLDGYIRRVQYWPRMLSDTEMQTVTT
jgi:hypothetical protein